MWLLVVTFTQIYNEKEKAKQGKKQNAKLKKQRRTRKCNEADSNAQGDNKYKERLI